MDQRHDRDAQPGFISSKRMDRECWESAGISGVLSAQRLAQLFRALLTRTTLQDAAFMRATIRNTSRQARVPEHVRDTTMG